MNQTPHILVVDNDPEIADLVGWLLGTEGWRVSNAGDTRAARRVLGGEPVAFSCST
jgi:DNA-binding response OmpR family regulator